MTELITVFDATGAQGGGLARAILADPARRFRVRAVTREPDSPAAQQLRQAGAQIAAADPDDAASVRAAMRGAGAAFCVTHLADHDAPARETAQARTMARAAAAADVRHVIWSTLEDTRDLIPADGRRMPALAGEYNVPHFDAKGAANPHFFDAGVPTTLLYAPFCWDDLLRFSLAPRRNAAGMLRLLLPIGERRLPGIAAEDIGRCAFGIFARGAELAGKSIGIAGEHLTGVQMAEQLSLALAEPVAHEPLSPAQYRALGFPGADALGNMFQFTSAFEHDYCGSRSVACARELNPRLTTFAGWLAANRSALRESVGAVAQAA
jgi:uncharacterized protein YbjT (DUF2867 family)